MVQQGGGGYPAVAVTAVPLSPASARGRGAATASGVRAAGQTGAGASELRESADGRGGWGGGVRDRSMAGGAQRGGEWPRGWTNWAGPRALVVSYHPAGPTHPSPGVAGSCRGGVEGNARGAAATPPCRSPPEPGAPQQDAVSVAPTGTYLLSMCVCVCVLQSGQAAAVRCGARSCAGRGHAAAVSFGAWHRGVYFVSHQSMFVCVLG